MRLIDKIFDVEFKIFGITVTCFDVLFGLILSFLGIMFRLKLYDIQSGDYVTAFADWMRECHEAGGFAYLGIKP